MTTAKTSQTITVNRAIKECLDAADRELMTVDLVKSSAELWAAVRLSAVLTLKQRGLLHETDDEILASINILDEQEKADGNIALQYGAAGIFRDNAGHDFLDLEEFLFCRPSAT